MKKGQTVLFYHSNCRDPGVYGTATVLVEGHPDESAFDPAHPYYDPVGRIRFTMQRSLRTLTPSRLPLQKSKRDAPTWFCPTLEFASKLAHPVTLAMLKHLATLNPGSTGEERVSMGLGYLTEDDHRGEQNSLPSRAPRSTLILDIRRPFPPALAEMPLVGKGRLSVQPVSDVAFAAIIRMGKEGGWAAKGVKGPWVAAAEKEPERDAEAKEATSRSQNADGSQEPVAKKPPVQASKKRPSGSVASVGGKDDSAPATDDGLRRSKRGKK